MSINRLFMILVYISMFSCQEIIEVESPDIDKKPVANCWFSDNTPFAIHLSFPKSLLTDTFELIGNAQVYILSGNITDTLFYNEAGSYTNSGLIPDEGETYHLRVEINGYENICSNDIIPQFNLQITNIEYLKNICKDEEGDEYSEAYIQLTDNNPGKDYYGISIQKKKENGKYYSYQITSFSPEILNEGISQYYPEILVFNDELFDGASTNVKIRLYSDEATYVRIYAFSEEGYKYIKSWIIHEYTQDYDFWEVYEPLPLYSNIENGYGIFAGYSSKLYEIYPDSIQTFNKWPGN